MLKTPTINFQQPDIDIHDALNTSRDILYPISGFTEHDNHDEFKIHGIYGIYQWS